MNTQATHTPTAHEAFYADQTPANAVRLAYADHRGYNNGRGIVEFENALNRAADLLDDPVRAAAPELLEALQRLYTHVAVQYSDEDLAEMPACIKARAAIARATGGL